jgi:hypothetical protein
VKSLAAIAFAFIATVSPMICQPVAAQSGDWINLMDGKTFDGWKPSKENSSSWKIKDGAFLSDGPRSHLFYDGPEQPFKNFELQAEVRTTSGSNGGIYFHTKYQDKGWPIEGYEIQVNQSHSDWRKSGSIYSVNDVKTTYVGDNEWYKYDIKVQGKRIIVKINDQVVNDWTEEPNRQPGKDFTRILTSGTIALQGHDPKSHVEYKNIRIRKLD